MEWSKPDCGYCEARGQTCKWKNGTNGGTECSICRPKRIPTSTVVHIAAGMHCYTDYLCYSFATFKQPHLQLYLILA